jgi:hypothetical protein
MNEGWWMRYEVAQDHCRDLLRDAEHQALLRSLSQGQPALLRRAAVRIGQMVAALGRRIEAFGQAHTPNALELDA